MLKSMIDEFSVVFFKLTVDIYWRKSFLCFGNSYQYYFSGNSVYG